MHQQLTARRLGPHHAVVTRDLQAPRITPLGGILLERRSIRLESNHAGADAAKPLGSIAIAHVAAAAGCRHPTLGAVRHWRLPAAAAAAVAVAAGLADRGGVPRPAGQGRGRVADRSPRSHACRDHVGRLGGARAAADVLPARQIALLRALESLPVNNNCCVKPATSPTILAL